MRSHALASLGRFERYIAIERRLSPHTIAAYALDLGALAEKLTSIAETVQRAPARPRSP